ncbi:hypothetical protein TNCV_3472701 [Trichonephila clavipes]|nr:hypothetical protein TNCV_3472701 [Trichonephila clavipes]
MQLQTGIEPLDSRRDKFTLKFWVTARRTDCRYWNEYRCATQRLNTRTSFFTCRTAYEGTPTSATNDSPCSYTVLHSRYCPSI